MKSIAGFPGHIKDMPVEMDMTIHGLRDRILFKLDFSFNEIVIFTMEEGCRCILNRELTMEMILKADKKESEKDNDKTITLFYEIGKEDLSSCPIIQSDHYFKR